MERMRHLSAHYENGLLRPERPLELKEGERVALIVLRPSDRRRWDPERLAANPKEDLALAEQGLGEWAAALDAEDHA